MLTESQQQAINDLTRSFENINGSSQVKRYENFNMDKINESVSLKDKYLKSVRAKNLAIAPSLMELIKQDFIDFNEEFGPRFYLVEGIMGFGTQRWNTTTDLINHLMENPVSTHYHGSANVFISVKNKFNVDPITLKVRFKQVKNPIKLPNGTEASASEVVGLEWSLSGFEPQFFPSLESLIQENLVLQHLMTSRANG